MFLSILIIVISFVLEIILNNFLPYMASDLSLFTPMFTLISLFLIYPLLKKDLTKYFVISLILGIIYDLFFTNLLFFNGLLFLGIAYIIHILYKYLEINFINIILEIIIIIVLYELLTAISIILFNLVPITLPKIIYKITHSIIINIIYGELVYLIINLLPKRYRSLSIN